MESHEDIIQRLTRIETKIENGLQSSVANIERWIEGWMTEHPRKCPLEERKALYRAPIAVGIITAVAVIVIDHIIERLLK